MLFSIAKGGTTMEHMDLGTLIVAGLCGIGLIQLVMWIVVMIQHPGCDDLRLDLVKAASRQSGVTKVPQGFGDDRSS
jgi:hypothetical protein